MQNFQDIYDYNFEQPDPLSSIDKPWFLYKKGEQGLLQALINRAKFLEYDMIPFWEQAKWYINFYENDYLSEYELYRSRNNLRQSWNLLRVCVDGHYNRIARIKPRVSFLTKGDKADLHQTAQRADDWVLSFFLDSDIYEPSQSSYKDGLHSNKGVFKFFPKRMNETFGTKRVSPFCIAVEKPYQGDIARDEILEWGCYYHYDIKEMIKMNAPKSMKTEMLKEFEKAHGKISTKKIFVKEIYKAGKKSALFTDRCVISYEDWPYPWIPYLFQDWDKKVNGFSSTGVAEIVTPTQNKINGMLYRIDLNTEFFTNPYVILPRNSQFSEMDNGFGRFYEANLQGNEFKPHHVTPPIMHPQVFEHLKDTYEMGLRTARLSDLQAEGRIPKGLNEGSGKALQYYNDIDNSRFFVNISQYERNFIFLAKRVLEWGCDIYPQMKVFSEIKKVGKNRFFRKANRWTGNLLPETPAGRFDVLSQLVTLQIIKPEKFMELLDAPDISGFLRSESSRITAIEKMLEENFYAGRSIQPDPVLGYEEQKEIALKIYARMVKDSKDGYNAPGLENVRSFLKNVKTEQEKIKKAQAQFLAQQGSFGGAVPLPKPPSPTPAKRQEPSGKGPSA